MVSAMGLPLARDETAASELKASTLTNLYTTRPKWLDDAENPARTHKNGDCPLLVHALLVPALSCAPNRRLQRKELTSSP